MLRGLNPGLAAIGLSERCASFGLQTGGTAVSSARITTNVVRAISTDRHWACNDWLNRAGTCGLVEDQGLAPTKTDSFHFFVDANKKGAHNQSQRLVRVLERAVPESHPCFSPVRNSWITAEHQTMKKVTTHILALCFSLLTASMAQAAFIVEAHSTGKANATNFSFGGDTTSASTSTAFSAAVGTQATGSIFGGNGSVVDTYVYRYTPGVNLDNTVFAPGTILGSTNGFPGQGNVATGFVGGLPGPYNVYFTVPSSTNVSTAGSDFLITQDGAPIDLQNINLNDGGTGPDTNPGTGFVGGANNAWYKLGTVMLTPGTTYTVTQSSNNATFVSQRGGAVMFEYAIPEPSAVVLAGLGLASLLVGARLRRR